MAWSDFSEAEDLRTRFPKLFHSAACLRTLPTVEQPTFHDGSSAKHLLLRINAPPKPPNNIYSPKCMMMLYVVVVTGGGWRTFLLAKLRCPLFRAGKHLPVNVRAYVWCSSATEALKQ